MHGRLPRYVLDLVGTVIIWRTFCFCSCPIWFLHIHWLKFIVVPDQPRGVDIRDMACFGPHGMEFASSHCEVS